MWLLTPILAVLICTCSVLAGEEADEGLNCVDTDKCPEGQERAPQLFCSTMQLACKPSLGSSSSNQGGGAVSDSPPVINLEDVGKPKSEDPILEETEPDVSCPINHGKPCGNMQIEGECKCTEGDNCPDGTSTYCIRMSGAVPNQQAVSSFKEKDINDVVAQVEKNENQVIEQENLMAKARSFSIGNPFGSIPPAKLCNLPLPFPKNCKITRTTTWGETPPIDIPLCQRIPCEKFNAPLDNNKLLCHSKPGCYFDWKLYQYRGVFGNKLYPGVPVCQLAIRNKFFLEKARSLPRWSSYFTHCLYNTFREDIFKETLECAKLPFLRAFGYYPKLSGWINIQEDECHWIGSCWQNGGCYRPISSSDIKIRSRQFRQEDSRSIDEKIPFGRAKCQNFDTRNPATIIKSMHICLASGCTVDIRAWMQYWDLFHYLGLAATPYAHTNLHNDLMKGKASIDNAIDKLTQYEATEKTKPPPPTEMNFESAFPGFIPLNPSVGCFGESGKNARPCPPPNFRKYGLPGVYKFPSFCPYKPLKFSIPEFGPYNPRFDGCCDGPHMCYFPKAELFAASSGVSPYYGRWTDWSKCSRSCGGGWQSRYRRCIAEDPANCEEAVSDRRRCNEQPCAGWGPYGPWGPCSKSCGSGIQQRNRRCNPSGNPNDCFGQPSQTQQCNTRFCVDKCTYSTNFEGLSQCRIINGKCQRTRVGYCNTPPCNPPCIEFKLCPARRCQ